ncbi:MAG: exosortase-dependent surface protein XDP1 [Thiobacillus sp.]|nr:exosortase-dependent surface protein XDP1 [Thiobacillus sp.]
MKTIRNLSISTVLALSALATSPASAATWTYSSTSPASDSGLTATATAFSAANNSSATIAASTAYYGGGLGVTSSGESTSSPQHAIDNNGAIETVMISFSNGVGGITSADKVSLTSASFGWSQTDADFSVYAYSGTGTPSVLGLTYSSLTSPSNGWTLIGHYNNAASSSAKTVSFANTVYSSAWLIGAYNGLTTSSGASSGNDYFKLASVTGNKCPATGTPPSGCGSSGTPSGGVPEPGTILLVGAGLLGMTRMSRRKAA